MHRVRIRYLSLFLSRALSFPAGESNKAHRRPNPSERERSNKERLKTWHLKSSSVTRSVMCLLTGFTFLSGLNSPFCLFHFLHLSLSQQAQR